MKIAIITKPFWNHLQTINNSFKTITGNFDQFQNSSQGCITNLARYVFSGSAPSLPSSLNSTLWVAYPSDLSRGTVKSCKSEERKKKKARKKERKIEKEL